ncbi:hypothetical protein QQZ08_004291 [Neonectria magnoliae]|uniref:Cyanovirin-N domain-containing protein n=1 Tax=Neonectria magnoliae TaxID=2732573 RepID=A0ABR1I8B2_9HYPO
MAFSQSSRNVRIEDAVLKAECLKEDNETYEYSEIPLDRILGNIDGQFQWGKQLFSQSARDINLQGEALLQARLEDEQGGWRVAYVNLDDHIRNTNGFLEPFNI